MLTRCPACDTAFRVSAEQLKAKQGKVRCGQCRHVFDALASLLDEESPATEGQIELLPAAPAEAHREEQAAVASPAADTENAPVYPREPSAEPLPQEASVARSRTWIWALCSLFALALLLLQAVVQFRTELSVLVPEAKPALRKTCALLGCELSLPHKPDLLGIEASDLHPDADNRLLLVATLKNRAPFAQAYPALEVTLTDIGDQPLLRKVIQPYEYLPKNADLAAGFAANSETALNLSLEADVSDAAGYRIYLFYP